MKSDPRLIERTAENKAQSEYNVKLQSDDELVVEFEVDLGYDSQINYENICGGKQKLCNIDEFVDIKDISGYFAKYGLTFSDDVKSELQLLRQKLQKAKDDDTGLYELSYRVNNDGSSEFYLPMETEYTEDFVVTQIYNSEGEFVAEDIEEDISYPVYKIESKQYYLKEISERCEIQVFSKKEQTFSEYMNSYHDTKSDLKWSMFFTSLIYFSSAYFYLTASFATLKFIIIASTGLFGFSIIMPLIFITSAVQFIIARINYKRFETYKTKTEFSTR